MEARSADSSRPMPGGFLERVGALRRLFAIATYSLLFNHYVVQCTSMPRARHDDPQHLLPLSPTIFHILLSLGAGERHGYAIKREIGARTGGKLKLGPGVLYSAINKMLDLGLIEETDERPDPHLDDERRRYYRITSLGRSAAQAEAVRMRELVERAAETFGVRENA
jgi:DNA-binding PadR family transcriptional regulator